MGAIISGDLVGEGDGGVVDAGSIGSGGVGGAGDEDDDVS
jgi:hypothetical protein